MQVKAACLSERWSATKLKTLLAARRKGLEAKWSTWRQMTAAVVKAAVVAIVPTMARSATHQQELRV